MSKKLRGFASDSSAASAARRTENFGCTGSGQECCPVELPEGKGWIFWTAHNYFNPDRECGYFLLPGNILIDPKSDLDILKMSDGLALSLDTICSWLLNDVGLHFPYIHETVYGVE